MRLKIVWTLLGIAAYAYPTALAKDSDEDDDSIEDTNTPHRPFYDTLEDFDDLTYYKKKQDKPTISEDAIFLPHETYCQYFYVFDGRDSRLYRCASGYRFDAEKLQCMKKKHVSCGKRKKNTGSSEEKNVGIKFKCPKWSGEYPHNHYCHLFFSCRNKKPNLFMCPPGKLFDKKTNRCLIRGKVKCEKREDPYEDDEGEEVDMPDEESEVTYYCPDSVGMYPDKKYCNKYIRCWYGLGEIYVCPEGKLYDVDLQRCRSKNSVYCYDRIDPYAIIDVEEPILIDEFPLFLCVVLKGRFSHDDCDKFIQCHNGEAKLYACPSGKLYDASSYSCRDASEVTCNKVIEEENEDDFVCPAREGIFKDEENCGSYYKCKKGKAQSLRCPEGELFDTDWKSCNHEDEVTCGDRLLPGDETAEEGGEIIDENPDYKCEKRHGRFTHNEVCNWYYHCKDGRPTVRSCKKGRFYDSQKYNCFDEVDCGLRKPKEDYEVTTQKPRDFSCPAKSGKFAHPRDCGAYYVCEKHKHKLHHCPEGKLFHSKWLSCAEEDNVICGDRIHPNTDPDELENKVIDPNPRFSCRVNHGQFDHEEYCDWYYNCHDKKATLKECKPGKYYDSKRRKCHPNKDVPCGNRKRPEDREYPTTTENDIMTAFTCPQANGKFPHRRDCSKFFECKKWNYKAHKCPKNKLFDSRRQSCEDDDHVICDDRIHPDMDPDEPADKIIDPNPKYHCKNNYGRFTHQEYCHWYYNCHNKKASVRECRPGKYYDTKKRRCYDSKEVSCDNRKKPKDEDNFKTTTVQDFTTKAPKFECPKPEGKYPHERDCGKFYDCKKSKYKVHDCPKEKLFNEKSKKCEGEEKVVCGNRIHPDDDPDEPEDKVINPNPDFKCKSNHGRYTHNNCDWYYHCRDRKSSVRECREGKYYDIRHKKCRNAKDVDCDNRIRPEDRTTRAPETTSTKTSQETSATASDKFPTTTEQSTIKSTSSKEETTTAQTITSKETSDTFTTKKITPTIEDTTSTYTPSSTAERPVTKSTTEEQATTTVRVTTDEDTTDNSTQSQSSTSTHVFTTQDDTTSTYTPSSTAERPVTKSTTEEQATTTVRVTTVEETTDSSTQSQSSTSTHESTTQDDTTSTYTPSSTAKRPVTKSTPEEQATTTVRITTVEETTDSRTQSQPSTSTHESTTQDDDNPDKIIDHKPNYNCNGDDGHFAHDTYCHYYYSCKDNTVTLRECPEGKYFDMERDQCEDWYLVTCGERLTPEEIYSTFDDFQSTPYNERESSSARPEQTTTSESVSLKPKFECPTSEGLYTHEKNCGKYYLCINNIAEEKECPKGHLYDVEKRTCNDEKETNCGTRIHPMDDPDNPNKIPDKVIDPNPNFNCSSRHGSFTHEVFCKWYYYCHDGRPKVRECAGDQYFDSERNKCLEWWMVFCDDRIVPDESTTMSTSTASEKTSEETRETIVTRSTLSSTENPTEIGSTAEGKQTISTEVEGEKTDTTGSNSKETPSTGRVTGSTNKEKITDSTTETMKHSSTVSDGDVTTSSTKGKTGDDSRETESTQGTKEQTTVTESDKEITKTIGTGSTDRTQSTNIITEVTDKNIGTRSTNGRITDINTTKSDKNTQSTEKTSVSYSGKGTRSTASTESGRRTKSTTDKSRGTGTATSNRPTSSTKGTTEKTGETGSSRETPSTTVTAKITGTPTTSRKDEGTGTTMNPPTSDRPLSEKCKEEDGDFIHPGHCKYYYTCKDGDYTINECPDGMLFEKNMRICYKEDLVDCGDRNRPEVTTEPLDDCDKWLRTRTTSPEDNSSPFTKGTTGPTDKGTGGTESTDDKTFTEPVSTNGQTKSTPSTTVTAQSTNDETNKTPDYSRSTAGDENTNSTEITIGSTINPGSLSTSKDRTGITDETSEGTLSSSDGSSVSTKITDISTEIMTPTDNSGKSTNSEGKISSSSIDNGTTTSTPNDISKLSTKSTDTSNIDESSTQTTNGGITTGSSTTGDDSSNESTKSTVTKTKPTDNPNISKESEQDTNLPSTNSGKTTKSISTTNGDSSNESTNSTVTKKKPTDIPNTSKEPGENTDTTPSTNNGKTTGTTSGITTSTNNYETSKSTTSEQETNSTPSTKDTTETTSSNSVTTGEYSSTKDSSNTEDTTRNSTEINLSTINPNTKESSRTESNNTDTTENDNMTGTSSSTVTVSSDDKLSTDTNVTEITKNNTTTSQTTHKHTTMHPCLTHTHSTTISTKPPKIDCHEDDIDCFEKKIGDVEKWYKCSKRQGHFPFSHSDKLFIRCRNWKPKLKRCSRNLVFSVENMRCVKSK